MKLLFLYGPPASGKLTIARHIADMTGYRLFHNHLVVDALGAVFEFGSEPFIELRERIWLDVMGTAAASQIDGLIFTFAPERTVRQRFIADLENTIALSRGTVVFARVDCDENEIERRLTAESRERFGKLTSVELYRELRADGVFEAPVMPEPDISVDSSQLEPEDAAHRIVEALTAG